MVSHMLVCQLSRSNQAPNLPHHADRLQLHLLHIMSSLIAYYTAVLLCSMLTGGVMSVVCTLLAFLRMVPTLLACPYAQIACAYPCCFPDKCMCTCCMFEEYVYLAEVCLLTRVCSLARRSESGAAGDRHMSSRWPARL